MEIIRSQPIFRIRKEIVMFLKMIQYCKRTFSFKQKKVDTIHGLEAGEKLAEAAGKMQVDPVHVAIELTQLGRVDDEMHTSIPSTLLANGRPKVEVLIFADVHGAPPAAEDHHLDQVWLLNIYLLYDIASQYLSWINHFVRNHLPRLIVRSIPLFGAHYALMEYPTSRSAEAVHHPDQVRGELSAAARGSLTRDKIFGILKRVSPFSASTVIATVVVAYSDAVAFAPSTAVTGLLIIMFADGLLLQMVHIFREEIFPKQARPWQYKLINFSIVLLFTSTTTCFVLVVANNNSNSN